MTRTGVVVSRTRKLTCEQRYTGKNKKIRTKQRFMKKTGVNYEKAYHHSNRNITFTLHTVGICSNRTGTRTWIILMSSLLIEGFTENLEPFSEERTNRFIIKHDNSVYGRKQGELQ